MGKGLTFRKNKRVMTEQKFNQERARLEKELTEKHNEWVEQQKSDITASTLELVYCLFFVALHNVFGFNKGRLLKIYEETNRLSDLIADGTMTWWDVRDEAERLGFVPANENGYLETKEEREVFEENEKA